jgi:RNA polymerase sigma-70 factor (ECF subfamily)
MTDQDIEDLSLLDRWCAGDKQAGTQLFRRHYRAIYRFFERKVDRDVEEAVQETFLVCVRKRDQFRRESSFATFLFAIARLVLHEHWRRLRRRDTPIDFDEISIASLSTSAGTRLARREDRGRMYDALRELALDQQLLLELHYWENLDGAALAAVFEVAPATIRSRLFRAREALRARLQGSEDRDGGGAGTIADFDAWARALHPDPGPADGPEASAEPDPAPATPQKVRNDPHADDAIES